MKAYAIKLKLFLTSMHKKQFNLFTQHYKPKWLLKKMKQKNHPNYWVVFSNNNRTSVLVYH